ncbi:uncharacterized protein JN550_005637 [Neoarthrinium moseri]|uniref:uncharacterized protein n=1 Tax=Neoarthrinium moseri TaxID=1658444 RepID=UPI001FDE5FB4|nr:uncharacterized protein JN550_005637 [Neoarthrinium moseri]KAI1869656.1 hypothetical protein JN550_005637 [Neoarthrinium moseri]
MTTRLDGPGLTLFVISVVLVILSWITVALRLTIRRNIKGIGADDWLMVAGLVFYTIATASTILAVLNGVGTRDQYLTDDDLQEGKKWFMFFQIFYVLSTVPIKSSICVALIRITTRKLFKWILYGIIFFTIVGCLVTDIAVLSWCQPISATWDPSAGSCADKSVIINVSYFISVISILTDWVCAILPAFILWNVQLRYRVKLSVAIVLGLGFVASTATIVRIRYLVYYSISEDYLYNIANIAIWSIVESGLGIVAGSMATLRPLLKYIPFLRTLSSSGDSKSKSKSRSKKTSRFGLRYNQNSIRMDEVGDVKTTCRAGENGWDNCSDDASQKHILRDTTIVVTSHVVQETGGRSQQNLEQV